MKPALRLGLLLSLTSAMAAVSMSAELSPGKKAPPLKIAEWVKGSEVKSFQAGRVYVVEFWATWCGPCIEGMPHLSEVQAKYKDKVTVIGVNSFERGVEDVSAKVKSFVDGQGDKMAYTVARDTAAGDMATNWMTAAAQNGIPTAFIVDQKGVVVWIGHPMMMDEPLEQVLNNTFDLERSKKDFAEQAAATEKRMAAGKRLSELEKMYRDGQKEAALKGFDDIVKEDPAQQSGVDLRKVGLLIEDDFAKGAEIVHRQMKSDGDGTVVNILLVNFVIQPHKVKEADAAAYAALKEDVIAHLEAHSLKDDYFMPLTLSSAYLNMKLYDKAQAMAEKGLAIFEATDKAKRDESHRKYFTDQIEAAKKAKADAGKG